MKNPRTCRLCRGDGALPRRHPLDEPLDCPDCDGLGVVEKDSETHVRQCAAGRNLRREHEE